MLEHCAKFDKQQNPKTKSVVNDVLLSTNGNLQSLNFARRSNDNEKDVVRRCKYM